MSHNNNYIRQSNDLRSSRKNIRELFSKKENCEVNLKKEIINEIFRESALNIGQIDKCFSPPLGKLNSINSFRSISTEKLMIPKFNLDEKLEQDKNISYKIGFNSNIDLIFDSVLGYYYDPKTNIYYEIDKFQ